MSPDNIQTEGSGPDGYPFDPTSIQFPWQMLVNEFLAALPNPFLATRIKPADYEPIQRMLKAKPEQQVEAFMAVMDRRAWHEHAFEKVSSRSAYASECCSVLGKLARLLLRRELPFTAAQARTLVVTVADVIALGWTFKEDLPAVLKICEQLKSRGEMTPDLHQALDRLKAALENVWESADIKRVKQTIVRLLGDGPPETPKHIEVDAETKAKDEALIKKHLQAIKGAYPEALKHTEMGRGILAADADLRASIAARALELWPGSGWDSMGRVASELLRANSKDWTASRLVRAAEAAAVINREHEDFGGFSRFPFKPLISAVEKAVECEALSPELRAALEKWKAAISPRVLTPQEERALGEAERIAMDEETGRPWAETSKAFETMEKLIRIRTPLTEERKLIERLSILLSSGKSVGDKQPEVHVDAGDAVGTLIASDVSKGKRANGQAWAALLNHARTLTATLPSKKWSSDAVQLVGKIKADNFGTCVSDWLNEAGKPARTPVTRGEIRDATLLNDCSVELLKGLSWIVVAANRADLAPALGNLAEACFKKIPNKGPRDVKVANAATAALAALADPAAAAQLSRLRLRVRHHSSRAAVDKALASASQKTGLSPDDLTEMSVPSFGLNARGVRRIEFGDHYGELRVANARDVELNWFARGEKACASVPAVVRTKHAEDLKRLKREAKDASAMLAAQALRLERSFVSDRSWPMKVWRQRFLEHPLVGTLARRLIWQFDDVCAIPHDGRFVSAINRPVAVKDNAVVSLWHPIRSQPDEVLAWREWLEEYEVTQPFKQAHREIYVLTDAERRTETYSNRFAAHILRQHQLVALCQSRGWDYRLQGQFDSHNVPTLHLVAHDLKSEFLVEAVENDATPRGIFLHVSSDQVRFGRPLEQVPPIVFSEVMRDVDLFVGVASVANDPTWQDGGPEGRYRTYWNQWSFGDLSESARTRKAALEHLLPKLAEAKRFSLSDKSLIVRGQLRTYKIHLGSGNILMEPNDQYLCIVANHTRGLSRLWLPFEGDTTLSVILSKALLLAADDRITDPTITRQIKS